MENLKSAIVPILIIMVSCHGCLNPSDTSHQVNIDYERVQKDSLAELNANQAMKDKTERDSLTEIEQRKVIGDIYFGMNEKETNVAIKSFVEGCRKDVKMTGVYGVTYEPYYFIGEYEFNESAIRTKYYEGKLWRVELGNQFIDWKKYDSEVRAEIEHISSVLRTKFGDPTIAHGIPNHYKTETGKKYLINSWTIGTKDIVVYLEANKTSYNVNLLIHQPSVLNLLSEQRKDSSVSKSKEGGKLF